MKKIVSLFMRNHDGDGLVRDEVSPGAEWVVAGDGVATQKHDGTCCLIRDGILYRRYEVKPGKLPPNGFEPACDVDPITGKQQGWINVGDGPADKYHREAFEYQVIANGTYELCGPKIQGNAENLERHTLIKHGAIRLVDAPRTFDALKRYLDGGGIEGIVWHHPDGRMVKIKAKDFGVSR